MPSTAVIVQARMSSTRLPGKVLRPLAGAPALARQLERLRSVRCECQLVVATSSDSSDDAIAALARELDVRCVRGPLDDVLARYWYAALESEASTIVRITGDCPLVDPSVIDACVELHLSHNDDAEYVSNVDQRTFPDGLDVEVFGREALSLAHERATEPGDREHVTPYIRRHCTKADVTQRVDLSALRWTLDVPEDYEFFRAVYEELYSRNRVFSSEEIYRLLVTRPSLIRTEPNAPTTTDERDRLVRRIEEFLSR